jgi:hypothetical protein
LVNWQTNMRPKKLGGLGIKDLEKFGRALWLRWLWHNWDHNDRPLKQLLQITDDTDRQLFFASTIIIVGDGKNTPLRQDGLMAQPLKSLPPTCSNWPGLRRGMCTLRCRIFIGLGTYLTLTLQFCLMNSSYCLWPWSQ